MKVSITTEIEIDLATCAKWFSALDDEQQAQFFIEVANISKTWGGCGAWSQFYRVGSHLKTCGCSTDEAREIVEAIHQGVVNGTH